MSTAAALTGDRLPQPVAWEGPTPCHSGWGGTPAAATSLPGVGPRHSDEWGAGTYDLFQEALVWLSWGASVIPVGRDKKPLVKWRHYQYRRPREEELGRHFQKLCPTGFAVITGRVPGGSDWVLAVRDFDAAESYHAWESVNPDLAKRAPTVSTGRGFHVYFRLRGAETYRRFGDGELIANRKHFVLAPPSLHPRGGRYQWVGGPPLVLGAFPKITLEESGVLAGRVRSKGCRSERPDFARQLTKAEGDSGHASTPGLDASQLPRALREAVLRTQPDGPGQRNGCLFGLARTLRDVRPTASAADLFPVVRAWWWRALPVIDTQEWEETWRDFRHAWDGVHTPTSQSVPIVSMMKAAAAEVGGPEAKLRAACAALAAEAEGGQFFLGCRTAAGVAGVSRATAARLLKGMVASGDLRLVAPAAPSATRRKASTYALGQSACPPETQDISSPSSSSASLSGSRCTVDSVAGSDPVTGGAVGAGTGRPHGTECSGSLGHRRRGQQRRRAAPVGPGGRPGRPGGGGGPPGRGAGEGRDGGHGRPA